MCSLVQFVIASQGVVGTARDSRPGLKPWPQVAVSTQGWALGERVIDWLGGVDGWSVEHSDLKT